MNNKFMYRIIGAISSLMILVSIFVPFFSYYGRTQSIWEGYSGNFIFLPILMIVFGVIGLVVFLLNKKIELAYATSGAMIFYSAMRTIEIMNLGLFSSVGIGYYCLIIGSLLTLIMTFLCNINSKEKVDNTAISQKNMINAQTENSSEIPAFSSQTDLMSENDISGVMPEVLDQSNLSLNYNQPIIDPISNVVPQGSVMPEIPDQSNLTPNYNQPIIDPISNVVPQEPVMPEIPDQSNLTPNYNQPIVDPISNVVPQEPVMPEIPDQSNLTPNYNQPIIDPISNVVPQGPVMPEIPDQSNLTPDYNQPIIDPISNVVPQGPVMPEIPDQSNLTPNYNQPIIDPVSNVVPQESTTIPSMNTTELLFDNQSMESPNFTNDFNGTYSFPPSNNMQNNETDIFGQPIDTKN